MARNGSGTYTKVNTFVSGNSITAAGHNQNWDDIVAEITNSVAADGQTSMTGPLKAASGTVAAPGLTFASDTDSGLYRIGANNLGVAVNGAKVVDVATTGVAVTGTLSSTGAFSATGTISQNGFALMPVGIGPLPWPTDAAPSGWLFANGEAVSRTTYALLFAVIGTGYGAGDGTTTFNLPDWCGRVGAGSDDMGGITPKGRLTTAGSGVDGVTLGAVGGAQTHTLTTAQLASHSHANTLTDPGHAHVENVQPDAGGSASINLSLRSGASTDTVLLTDTSTTGISINNVSSGGGSAHNNVQPTIVTNYIIFAGV